MEQMMVRPIEITLQKLREESSKWQKKKDQLSVTASNAESLTVPSGDAGIFGGLIETYNSHCATVGAIIRLGSTESMEAAEAIERSATAYENNEAESTEIIENTFDR